jgi:hypothetical protein
MSAACLRRFPNSWMTPNVVGDHLVTSNLSIASFETESIILPIRPIALFRQGKLCDQIENHSI